HARPARTAADTYDMAGTTDLHAGHAGNAARNVGPGETGVAWTMPPHDPRIPMSSMGIEHLTPDVTPFLPVARDTALVPHARPRELLRVSDGDTIQLTAGLVRRSLKGRDILMYGFNGQYPGPLIYVKQAAT